MANRIPEVRLQFGWLIYDTLSRDRYKLLKIEGDFPSTDECLVRVEQYKAAWDPLAEKLLQGMVDALELEFYKSVLDVYLAPFMYNFSAPLIMTLKAEPDLFIDMLTHEILHTLLADNLQQIPTRKLYDQLGAGETMHARNHIMVHAVLKYIYLDVLEQPERLVRDVRRQQAAPDYKRAWEIVEERGYMEIIKEFRSGYEG